MPKIVNEILLLALSFGLTFMSAGAFARNELSAPSKAVIEQARLLSTEGSENAARKELEKFPRAQLLTGLRDGLKSGAPWVEISAGAAASMKLSELTPDLREAFKLGAGWTFVYALGELTPVKDRALVSAEFLKGIEKSPDATAVAILETLSRWNIGLSNVGFEACLKNQSYEVRQAAVRNFLATRETLDAASQIARFKQSFAVKPFEVRLEAMDAFDQLSSADRKKLKGAVDAGLKSQCRFEKEASVKKSCGRVIASVIEKPK